MTGHRWEAYAGGAVRDCLSAAERTLERCALLARLSCLDKGICRVYLSAEHRAANDQVGTWLREAGCTVWEDAVGNLRGRYPSEAPGAPVFLLGSHLDSIPDAGAYDGVLGVLLGLALVERFASARVKLPFHLDVLGFAEEEGVRFGTTLMTSLAVAGRWDDAWWSLVDDAGVSLEQAFRAFGLDPVLVPTAARAEEQLLGYYEVHIEQGPVLEAATRPLGTVTGIAGNRRLRGRVLGQAGHAGTTPMPLRRDAGVAAAYAVLELERLAREQGVMATVGQLDFEPGGVNVIPGAAHFTIDIRALDDERRDEALRVFEERFRSWCAARQLAVELEEFHRAPAVLCAPWLVEATDAALAALGHPPSRLPSGAGHDAMALAQRCASGMLFLRCTGGISHHPDEAVIATDVAWALAALEQVVLQVANGTG